MRSHDTSDHVSGTHDVHTRGTATTNTSLSTPFPEITDAAAVIQEKQILGRGGYFTKVVDEDFTHHATTEECAKEIDGRKHVNLDFPHDLIYGTEGNAGGGVFLGAANTDTFLPTWGGPGLMRAVGVLGTATTESEVLQKKPTWIEVVDRNQVVNKPFGGYDGTREEL
ncbi:hypothetical protein HOY82DRAFT_535360 [Tuber indicum]|nr:hypothetical protein HOY82DRAFT_535360 [Tuber indicum]